MMLWVLGKKGQAGYRRTGSETGSQGGRKGKGEERSIILYPLKDCSGSLHAHSKGDVDREGKVIPSSV